jgi:pilus assembly protein CpaF
MIPRELFVQNLRGLLSPVRAFLDDPSVTEIMINGPEQIYIERKGRLLEANAKFSSEEALLAALRSIAQFAGKQLDETHPILEGRLPDGSRVQAIIPPASFNGVSLAIRRFSQSAFTLDSLVEIGALTHDAAATLDALIGAKLNVIIAGGTGSGKTSLLNTLSRSIPETDRILVIEETKEVQLMQRHVVYLEARAPDPNGRGAISIRDLFRATLRMRPDRIVIGEIRGGEALDIVQAMVSGHGGCLGTLHATYPRDTLTRLETMGLMSDVELPLAALRLQIASGVNIVVQVARFPDGARKVTHITEVLGYDINSMNYELSDLFRREFRGHGSDGNVVSEFVPTGVLPRCLDHIREQGFDLPDAVYDAARRKQSQDQLEVS